MSKGRLTVKEHNKLREAVLREIKASLTGEVEEANLLLLIQRINKYTNPFTFLEAMQMNGLIVKHSNGGFSGRFMAYRLKRD